MDEGCLELLGESRNVGWVVVLEFVGQVSSTERWGEGSTWLPFLNFFIFSVSFCMLKSGSWHFILFSNLYL